MFNSNVHADAVSLPTLLAIYERAKNHLRNETVMGNKAAVVRTVIMYALVEYLAELKKDEHDAMIEDARRHSVLEVLDKPEDVPIMLEAVNLLNQILNDYIPPEHTRHVVRETYDMSRKLNNAIQAMGRPIGPIGWRLQPDAGKYIEQHKSR